MSQPSDQLNKSQEHSQEQPKAKFWFYLMPLGIFAALVIIFFIGLGLNPRLVPSPLIDQPIPEFALPKLSNPNEVFQQTDLKGQVSLFNIWATWCTSCRQEHPVLMEIAKTKEVPIYGLFYKDDPALGVSYLNNSGDPYEENAVDEAGRIGIEWGAYGTPETFIIDKNGVIRYKHIGPISWSDWQNKLLPMIKTLRENQDV